MRRRTPDAVWITASVVLLVVALVLFLLLHKQAREEKIRRIEEKIVREETPAQVDEAERAAVSSKIVQEVEEKKAIREEAAAAAAERAAERRKKRRRYEVRNLPHLDSTPEPERARIDALVDKATDLSLTVEADRARRALAEIRKAAIPRLLNRFVGLDMGDRDHILIANILHRTLRAITGNDTIGFSPDGADDATQIRYRELAIRQWFQWWGEHQEGFE